jgi:molybdate transport system substrate-binding protein
VRILHSRDEAGRGVWLSLAVVAALSCMLLAPAAAQARDLVVYGEPTLEKALKSLGALWQARTGTRVNVFVAPSDLSYAQIERGARCDVIFALAGPVTDDAARRKIIHGDTIAPVLRNGVALIGTEAGAPPTAGVTLTDVGMLITGKRIAIANPDRDAVGARATELLRKLGIAVDDGNKAIAVAESSAGVVDWLAGKKAQLGIVYASDAVAGFKLVVPMPVAPIDYVAAQARDPASDTRPFMTFLKSPEAKATLKAAGLQTIDETNGTADASAGRPR